MDGNTKPAIATNALQGFKYFKNIFPYLKRFHETGNLKNRKLYFDQYLTLIIFYFFNPVLTSLRAIQQATTLEAVQNKLGVDETSLGALSEASTVLDADLLLPLIKELAAQALPLEKNPQLRALQQKIVAVDGSLLRAVPEMLWALWIDEDNRAAKLHLALDIERQVPIDARITHGNGSEKGIVREAFLKPDTLYLLDAGYAEYKFFQEIMDASSSFVVRIKDNAVWEDIAANELSAADKAAGIIQDSIVKLGSKSKQNDIRHPIRILKILHEGDGSVRRKARVSSKKTYRTTDSNYTFLLATDRTDLPAEVIALLYRKRWDIELFFRWFKCTLDCVHLIAHSRNGVTIQAYCALISGLLITIWTGRKPTKRTFEMLQFYLLGWATEQELEEHLTSMQEVQKNCT